MKKFSIVGIFSLFIMLSSCYQEPAFNTSPNIEFKGIKKLIILDQFSGAAKDSLIISIKFQDGDGDLGLDETQKPDAIAKNDYNYIIRLFRKKNGSFNEIISTVPYSGFFQKLRNDGKTGPIEGVLDYSLDFFHPSIPKKDSLKFQIYIKDRAGNSSNTVESNVVVLNEF
jgi:hypothetical protein